MKRLYSLFTAVLMMAVPAVAQSVPVNPKPGKVSDEEVAMTIYQRDTTAEAVVLADNTEVLIKTTDYLELSKEIQVYERIKVLKEDGKSWADYKIPYYKGDNISAIKVTTYNMEGGKVKKSTLDKKDIYRESVTDDVYTCSFSAPDVRVGSVIEVSYKHFSERYWDLPELVVQRTIPVNMSFLEFIYPDFLGMNRTTRGYFAPQYSQEVSSMVLQNNVLPSCKIISDHYAMADVPALPREPSNMCPRFYRCAVVYELSGITIPGRVYRSFSRSWEDVDAQVLQSAIYTQCRVKGKFLEPFMSRNEDEVQAIAEVRNAVLSAVKWDGDFSRLPDNVRDVLKAGTGDSASINAVVASVLNQMGYRARPVLLCGRSRGVLSRIHVSPDIFTNMILQIQTPSGQVHYLDAAPDYGFVDVLNPDFLVETARVVLSEEEGPSYWENIIPQAQGATVFMVNAELQPDGLVKGTIQMNAFKEASYMVRMSRDHFGSDEKYFQFVEQGEDFELVSGEYMADDYASSAGFKLEFEQEATSAGDMVYIKPFLIKEHHQGDFPPGERFLPVDFPFRETVSYYFSLQIPEGYAVEQLPPTVSYVPSQFKARAMCQSQLQEGNVIMISFTFKNDTLQIPAAAYPDLRSFWEKLCNIYLGTVVLKKQ